MDADGDRNDGRIVFCWIFSSNKLFGDGKQTDIIIVDGGVVNSDKVVVISFWDGSGGMIATGEHVGGTSSPIGGGGGVLIGVVVATGTIMVGMMGIEIAAVATSSLTGVKRVVGVADVEYGYFLSGTIVAVGGDWRPPAIDSTAADGVVIVETGTNFGNSMVNGC